MFVQWIKRTVLILPLIERIRVTLIVFLVALKVTKWYAESLYAFNLGCARRLIIESALKNHRFPIAQSVLFFCYY